MNLPSAVVPSRSTAELIEECAATVRVSQLARQQVAAALGEAVEQLAWVRHNAHLLREEAWGTLRPLPGMSGREADEQANESHVPRG